jgi:hypothetical protein
MLRDGLARQPELMLHGQPTAQLKKRLAIAFHQLVENRPSRWSGDCFEDVAHGFTIGKWLLACQGPGHRTFASP